MSTPERSAPIEPDHDRLLRANLDRVFNERDSARRAIALDDLFVADPVMYEPTAVADGKAAISAVAGALFDNFGSDFAIVADGPVTGHHGFAMLRWRAGPADGPVVASGIDAAEIVDGRIARLWVIIDQPGT